MKTAQCPYCKEEIKARATKCKHCHERLFWSREEFVMAAVAEIEEMEQIAGPSIPTVISRCEALCYAKGASPKDEFNMCLENCKVVDDDLSKYTAVKGKLHGLLRRELNLTLAEIIWGGGDIDPIEFEKLVIERFSRSGKP